MNSLSPTETSRREPDEGAVAGFRLERELGRGRRAVVYEAVQVGLDRHVALKLLRADQDLAAPLRWPEHPRVVRLYAAGSSEGGRYLAMQLVCGATLGELLDSGKLEPAASLELLADVASALDAAHGAGIAHGSVAARNVLIDPKGRALLSDFGLSPAEATMAADRRTFAALIEDCLGSRAVALPTSESGSAAELVELAREWLPAGRDAGPRRHWRGAAVASVLGLAVAAALVAPIGVSTNDRDRLPSVPADAQTLGSALPARGTTQVDCRGRAPDGASEGCTLVQTARPGRRLVPRRPGTIRRWSVREARGEVALQVIRRRGGGFVSVARSRFERVPGVGVHSVPAKLAVRAGDRIGVELAPGAAIGVRRQVPGAATARWIGPLWVDARPIELGRGTGFDHELMLRVDWVPGVKPAATGGLSGRSARHAPPGRELSSRTVEASGTLRQIAVVRLADGIAVDLFAGDRRLARLPEPAADPAGKVLWFTGVYGNPALRWRNPDGHILDYEYAVGASTLERP